MKNSKGILFEGMIVPHLDLSYNLACWLTRSSADAEGIVQEAYLRAYRYFEAFTGESGRAWMLTIVRDTCLTWQSRQKRESVMFEERTHTTDSRFANPEQEMLRNPETASLKGCIASIPVEYREILIMREIEELSYQEIADVASIPIGTVMSRLSCARKLLLQTCITVKQEHK